MIYHGNILTQIRNNRQGTTIDSLTYKYRYNSDQKLIRNRLYHINDAVNSTAFNNDIDDQGNFSYDSLDIETANNYVRDKMGRLVKDKQEYIDTILWTATNKVKAVIKTPSDTLKNVYFDYDAFGNQIAKHVYNAQTMILEKSTYYLLDAQSNQLSIYEHTVDTNESTAKYYLAERNIYGSARLGSSFDTINMFAPEILPSYGILGNRNYELTDHRNNIYTIISDIKYPISSDNSTIDSYEVGIAQITDYSPFGVELDSRTIQNSKYRYSFQNQEHHDEIKGKGNYLNYKYRGYDPRIGRLDWTLDPLKDSYPHNSPYAFSENVVINAVELEGLEKVEVSKALNKEEYMGKIWKIIDNSEILKKVYYSISRADRVSTNTVILGVIPTDESIKSNLKGITLDSKVLFRAAKWLKSGKDFEQKDIFEKIFKLNDIVPDNIIKSTKNIYFIGIDAADIGEHAVSGTKTFIHEINQHLVNHLNGKSISAEDAHYENHRDPNLPDDKNEEYRSSFSPEEPPTNSIQGKLNTEIEKSAKELEEK